MHRMSLELDQDLYCVLEAAAQLNHLTLEQECLKRLEGRERRSRYIQALVAELRADDEQHRASEE
ncbi:hypothetical protein [Pseudomonas sp. NA-150]|uniref:hypothetical protein n=1 Tax=Pseudomonas sp. NA-150 TaxID=3367525 RepID=UPI0037CC74B8